MNDDGSDDGRILSLRTRRWIEGNGGEILATIATLLLLIPSLADGRDPQGLFGHSWWWNASLDSAIVLVVASVFVKARVSPTREELLARDDRYRAWQDELREAIEVIALELLVKTVQKPNEARVSVYFHRGDTFVLVARTSKNPELKTRGRSQYPDSEGIISQVWHNGAATVVDLDKDESAWINSAVNDYGFDEETARGIAKRMRSRSFVGKRLERGHEQVGILLLESVAARGVNGKTLDNLNGNDSLVVSLFSVLNEMIDVVSDSFDDGADNVETSEHSSKEM